MTEHLDARTRAAVMYALGHARGHYLAGRASQLSGIPRSTLYEWRREEIYVPDFAAAEPAVWSYRDLVFLRLLGWLRQLGMPRPLASEQVSEVKRLVGGGTEIRHLRANKQTLLVDEERISRFTGVNLLPFSDIFGLMSTFDLLTPIEELRRPNQYRVWAPDLVNPSEYTFISPWILAGDPCVRGSRIPTSAIHALRAERGLDSPEIVELYPGLTIEAAGDAYLLERRLRGLDLPEPAAA